MAAMDSKKGICLEAQQRSRQNRAYRSREAGRKRLLRVARFGAAGGPPPMPPPRPADPTSTTQRFYESHVTAEAVTSMSVLLQAGATAAQVRAALPRLAGLAKGVGRRELCCAGRSAGCTRRSVR